MKALGGRPRPRNRGIALITAMLISALAGMVAYNLAWDNTLDVRRTTVLLYRDQGMQVALGAESWLMNILRQDLAESPTDHLGEIWAAELPGLPIDGGDVTGNVVDLQGRFNVNNLIDAQGRADEAALAHFTRLLEILEIDPRLAGITADWLDADGDAAFPDGAEDAIYTVMTPPYRTANQGLTSTSELLALDGMDKETFDRLEPHIAALPGRTDINVNTATPAVLRSLGANISAADVEALISERENGGFAEVETAFSSLADPGVLPTLDVTTNYFRLRVVVRIGTVRVTMYSVLLRGGRGDVTPILRSFGTA